MTYIALILLLVLLAFFCALVVIGLAVFFKLRKEKAPGGAQPNAELDQAQADEITSTWNLLNH